MRKYVETEVNYQIVTDSGETVGIPIITEDVARNLLVKLLKDDNYLQELCPDTDIKTIKYLTMIAVNITEKEQKTIHHTVVHNHSVGKVNAKMLPGICSEKTVVNGLSVEFTEPECLKRNPNIRVDFINFDWGDEDYNSVSKGIVNGVVINNNLWEIPGTCNTLESVIEAIMIDFDAQYMIVSCERDSEDNIVLVITYDYKFELIKTQQPVTSKGLQVKMFKDTRNIYNVEKEVNDSLAKIPMDDVVSVTFNNNLATSGTEGYNVLFTAMVTYKKDIGE